MPEQRQQKNDRQRDANQPKKRTFSQSHVVLLTISAAERACAAFDCRKKRAKRRSVPATHGPLQAQGRIAESNTEIAIEPALPVDLKKQQHG